MRLKVEVGQHAGKVLDAAGKRHDSLHTVVYLLPKSYEELYGMGNTVMKLARR